jgi:hypothetical protein
VRSRNGFLDEQQIADLPRKAIEDFRVKGISPAEVKRLEISLRAGNVGEAYIVSSLMKTILNEISLNASQRKLLLVYRQLERCCCALVELSRNLFDVEVWQHYRASGYESFEPYCTEALGVPVSQIQTLQLVKNRALPQPGKDELSELFIWLFKIVEMIAEGEKSHSL